MGFKLIEVQGEYFLLGHTMAKEVGQFFAERHITGEWTIYEVHSENDLVHEGAIIIASTMELQHTHLLDKSMVDGVTSHTKTFTQEDIRSAMMHMKRYMEFPREIQPEDPLVVISNYETQLTREWMCDIELNEAGVSVSGGFISPGDVGTKGLGIPHSYEPLISNGHITIITAI